MKIAVLTDSSAYLTKEQQEKYHIDVLPIPIIWGDKTYRDMIDIGYGEFYKKLADESIANSETRIKIHPFDSKITCAGEADYAMLAGRLVEAGADVDLIMHDLSDLQKTMDVRFMVDNLSQQVDFLTLPALWEHCSKLSQFFQWMCKMKVRSLQLLRKDKLNVHISMCKMILTI